MVRLAQKAFYPGQDSVSAAAHRHHLQVSRDDRIPRPLRARDRRAADRPHQPEGDRGRRESVPPGHAEVLRTAEDARSARCAGGRRLRRGLRRRAARRGEIARQGARLFLPRRLRPVGSEEPAARSCGTSTTAASTRARASACFRSPTGPSWTSGSTSTWRTSRSCRCTSPRSARCWCAAAALIPVEQDIPLLPGEKPQMVMCRMRSLGCSPCTGAIRSDCRHGAEDHRGDDAVPPLRAREPRDRSRPGRLDGDEEARGIFLMAAADRCPASTSKPSCARTKRRTCCASRPPAAWTTASPR